MARRETTPGVRSTAEARRCAEPGVGTAGAKREILHHGTRAGAAASPFDEVVNHDLGCHSAFPRSARPARETRRSIMAERVILCIGTRKGLFVAEAPKARRSFTLRGPFGSGVAVYAALIDTRGRPRLYASSCNAFFGMKVLRSTDLGKGFQETKSAPAFPKEDGRALANIWSLEAGAHRHEILCGGEPASLLPSRAWGGS